MALYIGRKDDRVVLASAYGVDQAYHEIGKVLGIDSGDTGNIDLDDFQQLPKIEATLGAVELFTDKD